MDEQKETSKEVPDNPMEQTSPASPLDCLTSEEIAKNEENVPIIPTEPHVFTNNSFLMWENVSNICWLDASLALLVHNQTMRKVIKLSPDCQVSKIITSYDEAITTLNDFVSDRNTEERLQFARTILQKVQESSLKYLQPLIKCKKGEPDSAFCSLLNLIKEDKLIQGFFDVSYAWVRQCENCETKRSFAATKPIITIANVEKFVPHSNTSPCSCHSCKKKDQIMRLVYRKLPACLIFHFEKGAGFGESPTLSFHVASREYQLTGVVVLEKAQESNVNHFVTYIRDPSVDKWLECNDLNLDIVSFTSGLPNFDLKDIYIYVYEAFDDLGTIQIEEDPLSSNSNTNIECIDISEESSSSLGEQDIASKSEKQDLTPNDKESEENVENIKAFLSTPLASKLDGTTLNSTGSEQCAGENLNSIKNALKESLSAESNMVRCHISSSNEAVYCTGISSVLDTSISEPSKQENIKNGVPIFYGKKSLIKEENTVNEDKIMSEPKDLGVTKKICDTVENICTKDITKPKAIVNPVPKFKDPVKCLENKPQQFEISKSKSIEDSVKPKKVVTPVSRFKDVDQWLNEKLQLYKTQTSSKKKEHITNENSEAKNVKLDHLNSGTHIPNNDKAIVNTCIQTEAVKKIEENSNKKKLQKLTVAIKDKSKEKINEKNNLSEASDSFMETDNSATKILISSQKEAKQETVSKIEKKLPTENSNDGNSQKLTLAVNAKTNERENSIAEKHLSEASDSSIKTDNSAKKIKVSTQKKDKLETFEMMDDVDGNKQDVNKMPCKQGRHLTIDRVTSKNLECISDVVKSKQNIHSHNKNEELSSSKKISVMGELKNVQSRFSNNDMAEDKNVPINEKSGVVSPDRKAGRIMQKALSNSKSSLLTSKCLSSMKEKLVGENEDTVDVKKEERIADLNSSLVKKNIGKETKKNTDKYDTTNKHNTSFSKENGAEIGLDSNIGIKKRVNIMHVTALKVENKNSVSSNHSKQNTKDTVSGNELQNVTSTTCGDESLLRIQQTPKRKVKKRVSKSAKHYLNDDASTNENVASTFNSEDITDMNMQSSSCSISPHFDQQMKSRKCKVSNSELNKHQNVHKEIAEAENHKDESFKKSKDQISKDLAVNMSSKEESISRNHQVNNLELNKSLQSSFIEKMGEHEILKDRSSKKSKRQVAKSLTQPLTSNASSKEEPVSKNHKICDSEPVEHKSRRLRKRMKDKNHEDKSFKKCRVLVSKSEIYLPSGEASSSDAEHTTDINIQDHSGVAAHSDPISNLKNSKVNTFEIKRIDQSMKFSHDGEMEDQNDTRKYRKRSKHRISKSAMYSLDNYSGNEDTMNVNFESCRYDSNASSNEVPNTKTPKKKILHVKFPSPKKSKRMSEMIKDENIGNNSFKKLEKLTPKSIEHSSADSSTSYTCENAADINMPSVTHTEELLKSNKLNKIIPYAGQLCPMPNQMNEIMEDESGRAVHQGKRNHFLENWSSGNECNVKEMETESSIKHSESSRSENFDTELSSNCECPKLNCDCRNVHREKAIDGVVDYFLATMFGLFGFAPNLP